MESAARSSELRLRGGRVVVDGMMI